MVNSLIKSWFLWCPSCTCMYWTKSLKWNAKSAIHLMLNYFTEKKCPQYVFFVFLFLFLNLCVCDVLVCNIKTKTQQNNYNKQNKNKLHIVSTLKPRGLDRVLGYNATVRPSHLCWIFRSPLNMLLVVYWPNNPSLLLDCGLLNVLVSESYR